MNGWIMRLWRRIPWQFTAKKSPYGVSCTDPWCKCARNTVNNSRPGAAE